MNVDTLSLHGKVAIVTGSGRENGIGAGIALALARNGAAVAISQVSDSSAQRVENVAEFLRLAGGKAVVVRASVDTIDGARYLVDETLARFESENIDILVNNAGVNFVVDILSDLNAKEVDLTIRTNINGPIYMTNATIPHMPPSGRIINISPTQSKLGSELTGVYACSKAALNNLTWSWAEKPSTNQWSRMGTGTIMVPEHSARLDLPRERVTKADADHSTIAKVNISQKSVWRILSMTIKDELAAMSGSLVEKPQQTQQEQQPSGELVHNAMNIPAITPDQTPSPSAAPWNSESELMGSPNPSETHTYQQRNSSPGGSPGHQFMSSLSFRPAPSTTVTSPFHLSADYFDQRSTTSQPLPSSAGQPSYSYRSSSGGGGSSSHNGTIASRQGMSRSGGTNTAASSTIIDSNQMSISSGVAPSSKGLPGYHCNLVEVFCVICRTAIRTLDYFWVCYECQIGSRVCASCHVNWSKNGQCVLHAGWNATRSIFLPCETRVQHMLEFEIPIDEILAIRALKPNDFVHVVAKTDERRYGALHLATWWHLTDTVEILLRCRGVQINELAIDGFTPLANAITSASACIVQRLLENGADIDTPVGPDGETPLHIACRLGFGSIVRLLTSEYRKRGLTSIDKANNAGKTALFNACEGAYWEAASTLLRAGADPLAEALDKSKSVTNGEYDPPNQIGMLAAEGYTEAISFLLNDRGDLSAECADSHSRTLLWHASANGHATLCQTLLRMGASPNPVRRDPPPRVLYLHLDSTPLYNAARCGFLPICKMLVEAGADMTLEFTIPRHGGKTFHWGALETAASNGHGDVVSYLLLQGAAAWPPAECGGKWKNLWFHKGVTESKKKAILQLLRAYKHSQK